MRNFSFQLHVDQADQIKVCPFPLSHHPLLTGFTVNRIRSVIPRSSDRRFHCRIALLFPSQDEDRIQKVVVNSPSRF
jgi:hypothetical protein